MRNNVKYGKIVVSNYRDGGIKTMADVNAEIMSLTQQASQFLQSGNENKYKVLMERVNHLKYSTLTDAQLMALPYEELQEAKQALEGAENLDVNKYNIVVNALAEKAPEEAAAQETAAANFVQEIGFDFDAYAGTGKLNQIASLMFKKITSGYELKLRQRDDITKGLEETVTNLTFQNKSLQETNASLGQYKLENEDYKQRFTAAEAKMSEYELEISRRDQEIERLKRRESELQQQIANAPAPTARQIVDISDDDALKQLIAQASELKAKKAEEAEAARKAALTKVTNLRWEDPYNRKNYLAELVTDGPEGKEGKTITINYLYLGKYVEVSAEEAERFRAEAAAASQTPIVESIPLVETPEIVTVEQFREEPDAFIEGSIRYYEGMDASTVGEVAPKSLEERVKAIEIKIERLENYTFRDLPLGSLAV